MRIIAGQRRGHRIDGPSNRATRPTSDLVRESIFNILGEAVQGATILDLFAGTGALGLEALSRGAEHAIFVECNWANAHLIERNIATLRYEDRTRIAQVNVYRFLKTYAPDPRPHVVLLDPPYKEYENYPDRVRDLLTGLRERLPAGSLIVLEAGGERFDESILSPAWDWDVRRLGGARIAVGESATEGASG